MIRVCYQRVRTADNAPKVVLVAALRKLLTMLTARVHAGTPWQPDVGQDT